MHKHFFVLVIGMFITVPGAAAFDPGIYGPVDTNQTPIPQALEDGIDTNSRHNRHPREIYVSPSGSDMYGRGDLQSPYRTQQKALIEAGPKDDILIQPSWGSSPFDDPSR
ncbi:MAG: hypothetical protein KC643_29355 [Nitrospira sp.]|nr:hypothetical protein [Nitrospira sp.]